MTTIIENMIQTIGGNKAAIMVGGRFAYDTEDNSVNFQFKGSRKCNILTLKYDEKSDLYNMDFIKYSPRTFDMKTISQVEGVFVDQVRSIFEKTTGLYLSL